eukprot:12423309-Karenia_brevis.AAC.1
MEWEKFKSAPSNTDKSGAATAGHHDEDPETRQRQVIVKGLGKDLSKEATITKIQEELKKLLGDNTLE